MKKILVIVFYCFLFFQISALASTKDIPDGIYTGEATVFNNNEKSTQSLFILVANNYISVLMGPKNQEQIPDTSIGFPDYLKTKRYKNVRFTFDGSSLKFSYQSKSRLENKNSSIKVKGVTTPVQEVSSNKENPFKGYYNQGILESGGLTCSSAGININSNGFAILNLTIQPESSGTFTQSFYGRFSDDGTFDQLYGGYELGKKAFNVTSISQTEDEIKISGTSDHGNFLNVFSKQFCELPLPPK